MSEEVEFYAEIKWETDGDSGALLLSDGDNEFWVPKSVIIDKELISGSDYKFIVPDYIAIDKGIV
jgi:hypothetical protein